MSWSMSNNWGMDSMGKNWGMDSMVDWGMDGMGNNWGMDSMSNWGSSSVMWLSLIGDISNITIIVVGVVLDVLDSAVGKVDRVFSINNTSSVVVLSLLESSTRVVISNSISISVDSWAIISRRRVSWVNNGSMVDRGMVDRGMVNRDMVDRGVVDRSSMKDGSMVDSMMNRGMVNSMMSRCMMNSMMERCGMEDGSMVSMNIFVGMEGNGGMVGSSILLLVVVLVDLIGGGSRLAVDSCTITTMGLVDGGSHRWGIAVFDELVAVLIGNSQSQEG